MLINVGFSMVADTMRLMNSNTLYAVIGQQRRTPAVALMLLLFSALPELQQQTPN